MGFLWGRRELLQRLPTFREDFIPNEPPGKIEAGTFIYENVAGMDAAVRYLESLGRIDQEEPRRTRLERAFASIRAYEETLSTEILRILNECGAEIYGVSNGDRIHQRVPTFCFNFPNKSPARVTEELANRGIGVRDGHMYSPRLMRRLGLSPETGAVRASLVHYNTLTEVQNFAGALAEIRTSC
jgi:selenocysteine lyase/cysteine desulfurase